MYSAVNAKELQTKIEEHRQKMARIPTEAPAGNVQALLAVEHSEIFICASQLAEISTRRIILLTRWLVGLTIGLLFLTLVLAGFTICLYEDTHADAQHHSVGDRAQLQQPQPAPKP